MRFPGWIIDSWSFIISLGLLDCVSITDWSLIDPWSALFSSRWPHVGLQTLVLAWMCPPRRNQSGSPWRSHDLLASRAKWNRIFAADTFHISVFFFFLKSCGPSTDISMLAYRLANMEAMSWAQHDAFLFLSAAEVSELSPPVCAVSGHHEGSDQVQDSLQVQCVCVCVHLWIHSIDNPSLTGPVRGSAIY